MEHSPNFVRAQARARLQKGYGATLQHEGQQRQAPEVEREQACNALQ